MSSKYFDTASGSVVEWPIISFLKTAYQEYWKNPSSISEQSSIIKMKMEESRKAIADYIGAEPEEIYFTSCATESNNLAIKGFINANQSTCGELITSPTEHPSVFNIALTFQSDNECMLYYVSSLHGLVDLDDLENALYYYTHTINGTPIEEEVPLVSIMFVNNELGTINPVKEIGTLVHKYNGIFHTDATQAFGRIPINVKEMRIDMMTFSFSKIGMPKGLACLYVKKGIKLTPLLHGGGQEQGLRSGTENAPMIIVAKELMRELSGNVGLINNKWTEKISDYIKQRLPDACHEFCDIEFTVPDNIPTSPHIISVRFKGYNAQDIVTGLSIKGYQVSAGSACSAGSLEPSRVLTYAGLSFDEAKEVVRISIDHLINYDDVEDLLQELKSVLYLNKAD